jgi:hypothetical protein
MAIDPPAVERIMEFYLLFMQERSDILNSTVDNPKVFRTRALCGKSRPAFLSNCLV